MTVGRTRVARERRDDLSLDGLSFFLADVQDNLGAFLTAFLATAAWSPGRIGVVMAAGGVGAVVARCVGGWALDILSHRRRLLAICCLMTLSSIAVIAWVPLFWPLVLAHFLAGSAGALFTPVLAAISRHTAGRSGYIARMGRNESFNHLGNATCGISLSMLGRMMGPLAPLWGLGTLTALSLGLVGLFTPRADEPPVHPRQETASTTDRARTVIRLLATPGLPIFFLCYLLFNLANGAILPLMIERHVFLHLGDPATLTAVCIVIAQITMAPVAYLAGRYAPRWPRKPLFIMALALQPLRDGLLVLSAGWPALCLAEVLDGLSSGIILVLFYAILADITPDGGRQNLLIGVGLALGTVGALLSNLASGLLTSLYGCGTAFMALGVIGAGVTFLFWQGMPETHRPLQDVA